jgi:hypothetical protein
MPAEGMVDALHRAATLLAPEGVVVDIHPTIDAAIVEMGGGNARVAMGALHAEGSRARHAAADAAIVSAIASGRFVVESVQEFSFRRYADSIAELQDYVAHKWEGAFIDDATAARVIEAFRRQPTVALWLDERARATKMRPATRRDAPRAQ